MLILINLHPDNEQGIITIISVGKRSGRRKGNPYIQEKDRDADAKEK